MEVDRRRMQLEQHPGCLGRARFAADVLAREILEAELAAAAALPEEIAVQPGRIRLRGGEQLGRGGALEVQQHVRRLDLRAPPMRRLHLERGWRLREHCADLELALLL